MVHKKCFNCGRTCWHNPRKKAEDGHRCTYCGHPVVCGSPGSSKRDYANMIRDRQARKAS